MDIKDFQRFLLYMYIVHYTMVKLKKKTERKYIFSTVFMEEKGLFLREKIKLPLYSMFIKHRAYDKLKYIYIANLFTKHWAYIKKN